ncbi:MAG: TldD/PmbA family protein [Candidatus Lokiarchaeota archaeon]|nr:TldD/PmbA family protein [Candidatus Lokiarchaeota archaeon]
MEISDELKEIDENLINQLNRIANDKAEFWDIRAKVNNGTTLDFINQKSKEISSFEINSCGIRAFKNGGWGFSVLKDLKRESIKIGLQKAIKLARLSESLTKIKFKIAQNRPLIDEYKSSRKKNLEEIDIHDKINLVKNHEKIAANYSTYVKNTHTIYMDGRSQNLYLNSFGSNIIQDLSFLRLFCIVFTNKNGATQSSVNSVAGIGGYEIAETEKAINLSKKTAKEAVELLDAISPIGGKLTVIADSKLTGTIIHEAFGHACEADLVLNNESVLEGMIGEKVASEDVSIIDNPSMGQGQQFNLPYELFGCYYIDDEGIPSQKTKIIENGILKNYLHNLETSSRMKVPPNGHGRASASSERPQVRMGFTYLEPKDWNLEDIIEDTKEGILCEDFQYGYTDPTTGNFQFKCRISFKIKDGEKKEIMRDVSLSGMILEALNKISAIGNQKTFNYSVGMCGKGGQHVRVCDGAPYIRIEDMTVGGLN